MALKTKMSGKHRSSTKKVKRRGPDDPPKYSVAEYKRDSVALDKSVNIVKKVHRGKAKPGEVGQMDYINARRNINKMSGNKAFQNMYNKRNPKK